MNATEATQRASLKLIEGLARFSGSEADLVTVENALQGWASRVFGDALRAAGVAAPPAGLQLGVLLKGDTLLHLQLVPGSRIGSSWRLAGRRGFTAAGAATVPAAPASPKKQTVKKPKAKPAKAPPQPKAAAKPSPAPAPLAASARPGPSSPAPPRPRVRKKPSSDDQTIAHPPAEPEPAPPPVAHHPAAAEKRPPVPAEPGKRHEILIEGWVPAKPSSVAPEPGTSSAAGVVTSAEDVLLEESDAQNVPLASGRRRVDVEIMHPSPAVFDADWCWPVLLVGLSASGLILSAGRKNVEVGSFRAVAMHEPGVIITLTDLPSPLE